MAMARRMGRGPAVNVWPGFVDAVTSLLLVLFFVLTIFMVVQFVLRETITGQETQLDRLSGEVQTLAQALGLEQQRSFQLEEEVGRLGTTLRTAQDEAERQAALIATLRSQTEAQAGEIAARDARITAFEAQVAGLLSERDAALQTGEALRADLADAEAARDRLVSEQEALNLALARARDEIDAQSEAARLAAAQREALDAMVAEMRAKAGEQDRSLAAALAALDAAKGREEALSADLSNARDAADEAERKRLEEAAAAEALRQRLEGVQTALTEEEQRRLAEAAAAEALRARLADAGSELTAMTLALEEQRKRAEETLTLLAAAESARDAARAAEERALTDAERRAALLATANKALETAEAAGADSQREVTLLNQQVAALRTQLGDLQAILDQSEARDAAAQVQIRSLGQDLNAALARVASEQRARADAEAAKAALEEAERRRLEAEAASLRDEAEQLSRFRSDFFAQVGEVLAGREGVRVVGDRFVFSSDVLFEPAQVDLLPEGKEQIRRVVEILDEVKDRIPPGIDWIIRVDGFTDDVPLSGTGRYRDNWELSQGRALSAVRYMVDDLGFPPERLAATGFGEYQPVAFGDTPEARAQNRRIELKLTER